MSSRRRAPSLAAVLALLAVCGGATPARATDCFSDGECPSGHCVDQVCCDTACDAPCQACSAAAKGTGVDGVCELVAKDHDPHGDCDDDGVATCDKNGFCDGAGQCDVYAPGSICKPHDCSGALDYTPPDLCDGAGTCVPGGAPVPCLHDDPCAFDLCGADGCEQVHKTFGTACGDGKICDASNACVDGTAGGGTGGSGDGGSGGDAASGGGGNAFPGFEDEPKGEDGCGCRTAATDATPGAALAALAALVACRARRRSRRRRGRSVVRL